MNPIPIRPDLTLYHSGPSLDHGPLPSFFYFALSGSDSLTLDPFNQPVQFLRGKMIRIFSLSLPGHEHSLPASQAIQFWAEEIAKGKDPIEEFLEKAHFALEFALRERWIDPRHLGVAGLSRGGFIATHFAAQEEKIRFLLGFAPLTSLKKAREFSEMEDHPLVHSLDLVHLTPSLIHKHTRFYIGNRDTRVGTRACFSFIETLSETAYQNKIRTPQAELIVSPSIGQMGHGTSPEIFCQGAHWMERNLTAAH